MSRDGTQMYFSLNIFTILGKIRRLIKDSESFGVRDVPLL